MTVRRRGSCRRGSSAAPSTAVSPTATASTGGILEPVKEFAPVVERIDRDPCDGWTPGRIARALNRDGVPAAQGGESKPQVVRQILLNPVHVGERYSIRNAHSAIMSRRLWNRAQAVLAATARPA